MDSISFKIENQDCNDLKVSFESGLTCKFPGKSPLQKNLNVCEGDDGDNIDIDYV
jgi:hypothetical protein